MSYLKQGLGTRSTPQHEPIPGSTQAANNAGGYAWKVDDWQRLERWLVLGSEGGSYYVGEREMTVDNVQTLMRCLETDPAKAVELIATISEEGRALRNSEAVFALAVAAGHPETKTRQLALAQLDRVCRIPTHLFEFIDHTQQFRGWGRSLRRAVGKSYAERPIEQLGYHLVKYRQRNGWAHRDLLRLSHPGKDVTSGNPQVDMDAAHESLLRWAVGKSPREIVLPDTVVAFEEAQRAKTPKDTIKVIETYGSRLPREGILTEHLTDPGVLGALLDVGMPTTALIRNLGNLTRHGVLKPLGDRTEAVCKQLTDRAILKKARIHPITVLFALATYKSGRGFRGDQAWTPISDIVGALDEAFYACFDNVEPSGKRFLFGLDVSGSMNSPIRNSMLTCMEAALAMAMVSIRTEPRTYAMAFDNGLRELTISKRQRLDDALASLPRNYGGTDCSLPMLHAIDNGLEVDVFTILTDNETWAGRIHPSQALERYRMVTGIPAKLVVVGMVANEFTIANPSDPGMLDVVGMDPTVPAVISDFAR